MGDLSGDGRPDLAVANIGASTVSVLLGNGTGGFGARTDLAAWGNPRSVALGDVSGDGTLDLATAIADFGTVSVRLGLVPARVSLAVSPNPVAIHGTLDLVASVTVPGPGSGSPTGMVSFFDGTTLLGTAPVIAGSAGLTFYAPHLGRRSFRAEYGGGGRFARSISPACDARVVATLAPVIASVRDVPNDQGGKVKVSWHASVLDTFPNALVANYLVYRSVPPALAAEAARAAVTDVLARSDGVATTFWEHVGTVSAAHLAGYSYVAATLGDSVAGSNPFTQFMIEARSADGSQWWDSAPDSGYSVDDLAPPAPAPFTGEYLAGTATLHWGPSPASDFAMFRLFRGVTADFVPGPENLVATQADTGYVDVAGSRQHYKLTAVDVHGNEGPAATLLPEGTVGVPDDGPPLSLALEGIRPTPWRGGRLTVSFALPGAGPARLELLDVSGRRVAAREVGALGAGRHVVDLAAERRLTPGLYLVRLTRGAEARVARMTVLD
jgi:hypothetical protein